MGALMASLSKIALCLAAAFSTVAGLPVPVAAQTVASTRGGVAQTAELEQLVAPIALYPDALLSQILMASTYPLEVVEAARWQKDHPDLTGADLEAALQGEDWDASVKSLVAFPSVLDMMNQRLSWTSRLGDVFLSQQDALMDQVQVLRSRAQAAGNLRSGSQQTVTVAPSSSGSSVIRIEPAQPDVVYVPVYNPTVVYGPWLYPAYTPFYWYPPGYIATGVVFSFGVGLFIGHALWGGYDWHAHRMNVVNVYNYNNFNRTRFSHVDWQHDSYHRRNVAYGDPGRGHSFYGGGQSAHFAARETYRARADAWRRDLPNIDRTSLRDPGRSDGRGMGSHFGGDQGSRFGGGRPDAGGDRGMPGSRFGGQGGSRADAGNGAATTGSRSTAPGRNFGGGAGMPGADGGRGQGPQVSRSGQDGPRGGGAAMPSRPSGGVEGWAGHRGGGAGQASPGAGRGWNGPQGGREFGGGRDFGRGAGGGYGGGRGGGGNVGMAGGGGGGHHGGGR